MARTSKVRKVAHVAGPPVWISGRWIQRCAVCGWKLIDVTGPSEDPPPLYEMWDVIEVVEDEATGKYLRHERVGSSQGNHKEAYPKNGCLEILVD